MTLINYLTSSKYYPICSKCVSEYIFISTEFKLILLLFLFTKELLYNYSFISFNISIQSVSNTSILSSNSSLYFLYKESNDCFISSSDDIILFIPYFQLFNLWPNDLTLLGESSLSLFVINCFILSLDLRILEWLILISFSLIYLCLLPFSLIVSILVTLYFWNLFGFKLELN